MAAEKENNIIFDFTWGNTYGLFAEGYHVMIKGGGDLYLTWSVDLKYGETPLDNAKLDEFIKDLKALKLDSWNGRTYSDSSFENSDTWKIEVNHITLIMESKGANDYPPEWKQFLEYLHLKWSVPVSSRELPAEERMKLQKKREKEEQETRASQKTEKAEKQEKKDTRKKTGNNNGYYSTGNNSGSKDHQDNRNKNKDRQGSAGSGKKREQARPHKDGPVKEKERDKEKDLRRQKQKNPDNENGNLPGAEKPKSDKPKKFRYHRRRRSSGPKDTQVES